MVILCVHCCVFLKGNQTEMERSDIIREHVDVVNVITLVSHTIHCDYILHIKFNKFQLNFHQRRLTFYELILTSFSFILVFYQT